MALDENDLKQIGELVSKSVAPISEKIGKIEADFPGMSKRHANDAVTSLQKSIEEWKASAKPAGDEKKSEGKSNNGDDRTAKLEAELNAMKVKAENQEKRAAVISGLSKVPLLEGVAEDYAEILIGRLKRNEAGELIMPTTRKLENTGETIAEDVSVEIGINRFFEAKPALKKANVKGGAGATGSSEGGSKTNGADAFNGVTTYKDLMSDPAKMWAARQADPARVDALRAKADAERAEKRR